MLDNKLLMIFAMVFCFTLNTTSIAYDIINVGFTVNINRIDGPDYFGKEPKFKAAYKALRSRYGNDYLPDELPKELHHTRDQVYKYIQTRADTRITGGLLIKGVLQKKSKKTYHSGENGKNNGKAYDYSREGLPTKIARLSYCFGISPRILTAQIEKESEFIADAVSWTGAVGFMQVTNVAAVEVSEQLGFNNDNLILNEKAKNLYENYINCFLSGKKKWTPPWEAKNSSGKYVMPSACSKESFTSCSEARRHLKKPYAARLDLWLTGKYSDTSHDNGLIYGAVYLKFLLGHKGIVKGLIAYNGDPNVKKQYSKKIRQRAGWMKVDLNYFKYDVFGVSYNINNKQREPGFMEALGVLENSADTWDQLNEIKENHGQVIEEIEDLEVPRVRRGSKEVYYGT